MSLPGWLTEYGQGRYNELLVLQEGENKNACRKRIKNAWMEMLRNSRHEPIVHVGSIMPACWCHGWFHIEASQSSNLETVITCWIWWKEDGRLSI
jgi:hypothetical protein